MRAGTLRHKVEIQSSALTKNSLGEAEREWATFARPHASVVPLSGVELFRARQVTNDVTHEVRLRYFAGLLPAMRIIHNSRVLEILSAVNVDERNDEWICMCKEHINV